MTKIRFMRQAGHLASLCAALALASCGGSSLPGSAARSASVSRAALAPNTACASQTCIYAASLKSERVTVFHRNANGNVPPVHTINGPSTGFDHPYGIALDAARNMYGANYSGNSISVYAAGADGDASPIAVISGSNTGLSGPRGLSLDSSGNIYVANRLSSTVAVFAAGSNGNVPPTRTIAGAGTGLVNPTAVVVDGGENCSSRTLTGKA